MLRTLANNQPGQLQEQQVPLIDASIRPPFMRDTQNDNRPTQEDKTACRQLYDKLIRSQHQIKAKLQTVSQSVKERNFASGMGYYDAKNLLFMEYLIQLQFYQLFRVNAVDLTQGQGLSLYKRLVYLKTILNKLGPVEKKLDYHKNKLLRSAEMVTVKAYKQKQDAKIDQVEELGSQNQPQQNGQGDKQEQESGEQDTLNYRPSLNALMQVKKRKDNQQAQQGKYIPVKGSAALSKQDQKTRKIQRQQIRRKAHIVRQYINDFREDDEARQAGMGDELTQKIKKKFQEKADYQEQYFMRMPQTKKEKFWINSMKRKAHKYEEMKQGLKDIELVGQIFKEQRRELSQSRLPRDNKQGRKKVKR